MSYSYFANTFKNLQIPVVVCRKGKNNPLVFVNASVKTLLMPAQISESPKAPEEALQGVLRFFSRQEYTYVMDTVEALGSIHRHKTALHTAAGEVLAVFVSANCVEVQGLEYIIFYIDETAQEEPSFDNNTGGVLPKIFHAAYHTGGVNESINKILGLAGGYARVSRAYIFEEISATVTRNTYEWCAEGIAPAIQDLQELEKEKYSYDVIVQGDTYIINDVSGLPQKDRAILEAQNIKSLAILPLYYDDKPIGYIGFDDCEKCRKWSGEDIRLLKNIADILAILIIRRNAEEKSEHSLDVMQTISDNIDSIIYVSDIHNYEVKFVNKTLANTLQKPPEEIVGKVCWRVLQQGKTAPCEFCPIPKLYGEDGKKIQGGYSWEFKNTITGKWYLVRDSIIPWVDGTDVHIETATEITHQKQYEEQLKYYASIDTMTGCYKREWGYKVVQDMMASAYFSREALTLCFLDMDGLKKINDTQGHDAGDSMIVQIVDTLRERIRKSDVIARWGGDEFLLLLKCDTKTARAVMQDVQNTLEEVNRSGVNQFALSFSYGITPMPAGDPISIDALISKADQEMYQNKLIKKA